jgi:hypothetical protein
LTIALELTKEILDAYLQNTEHKYLTTHKTLCFAIIKRIHRRVLLGHRFGAITVCETKGIVVDGNHRFIAYSLAGIAVDVKEGTSNHSDVPKTYNEIIIDQVHDWDMNSSENKKFCSDDFLKDLN